MTHDGSTYGLNSRQKIIEHYRDSVTRINISRENSGINDLIISVGDTPSASVVEDFHGINELRPGNFVFYDLMQYINCSCQFENIAVALLCPVIDIRPDSQTIVVHGGAIHFSKESIIINGKHIYGMVAGLDNTGWQQPEHKTYLSSLSQEHGIIHCSESRLIEQVQPGDLLAIIPVHSCLTADCMGSYMLTDGKVLDHLRQASQESIFSFS